VIVDKPWGRVTTYTMNQPASVRVIEVDAGAQTSLHYHELRDEVWIVLDPGLTVVVGEERTDAKPGDEFVVSAERPHQILSRGAAGRVLEIAYGFTTEDDTHRLSDQYGRSVRDR